MNGPGKGNEQVVCLKSCLKSCNSSWALALHLHSTISRNTRIHSACAPMKCILRRARWTMIKWSHVSNSLCAQSLGGTLAKESFA